MAAATIRRCPLVAWARAFLMKWTRQRCHVALEHLGGGRLEPLVGIRDHQLDATQAAPGQGAQEVGPEGLGFRGADGQTQNLTASLRVGADGDYRRHRDDPPGLPHLDVGGVEPQIGPVAFDEGAPRKACHPLVDLLAEPGHLALGDARHPHGLDQIVDAERVEMPWM